MHAINFVCMVYVGRDITREEERAVVEILSSAAVSAGVVCGEIGPQQGQYHLQCLWRVAASSTAAISSYIKRKVIPTAECLLPMFCCCCCCSLPAMVKLTWLCMSMLQVWGASTEGTGSVCVKQLANKGVHQWIPMLGYCFKDDVPGNIMYLFTCINSYS